MNEELQGYRRETTITYRPSPEGWKACGGRRVSSLSPDGSTVAVRLSAEEAETALAVIVGNAKVLIGRSGAERQAEDVLASVDKESEKFLREVGPGVKGRAKSRTAAAARG